MPVDMIKKALILILALIILINAANAADSSNWTTAKVGYEEFKIPPQYENPYKHDFHMYEYGEDIDEFTIRYVNPRIMSLLGYFIDNNHFEKVNVSGRDAVHFTSFDRYDQQFNSKLWFSSGEDFYYITWRGKEITPDIEEIVKSSSPSKYSHEEFYSILNDEYDNYKFQKSIESQNYYPSGNDRNPQSFVTIGNRGFSYGIIF